MAWSINIGEAVNALSWIQDYAVIMNIESKNIFIAFLDLIFRFPVTAWRQIYLVNVPLMNLFGKVSKQGDKLCRWDNKELAFCEK